MQGWQSHKGFKMNTEIKKIQPEDDAYLAESGRILLDYLGLNTRLAKQ